jgi:hypothetical protein
MPKTPKNPHVTTREAVIATTRDLIRQFCETAEDPKRPRENTDVRALRDTFRTTVQRVRMATLEGADERTLNGIVAPLKGDMHDVSQNDPAARKMIGQMTTALDLGMTGVYKPAARIFRQ